MNLQSIQEMMTYIDIFEKITKSMFINNVTLIQNSTEISNKYPSMLSMGIA